MNKKNMWEILGIHMTTDVALIKEAYAKQAKHAHPEENPEAFMQLQEAFQQAMRFAKMQKQQPDISIAADVFDQSKQEVNALPNKDFSSVKMQEYFKEAEWNYHQNQQKLMEEVFSDIKYMFRQRWMSCGMWEYYLNQKEVRIIMMQKPFMIYFIQLLEEEDPSFFSIKALLSFYRDMGNSYDDKEEEFFLILQKLVDEEKSYRGAIKLLYIVIAIFCLILYFYLC